MIGILQKQGAAVTGWRDRLFVLDADSLCYFDVPPGESTPPAPAPGASPRGVIATSSLINVLPSPTDARVLRVTVDAAASLDTYCVLSGSAPGERQFELLASSDEVVAKWAAALTTATFSPARAVRLLRDLTTAWRDGTLCTREWELSRALVAAGTTASLKTAGRLLDGARSRPRNARASDAVESALLDFALANSEAALVGVLAGLRRLCREPLRASLREKIITIAISKYGNGGGDGAGDADGTRDGGSPVPESRNSRGAASCDGIAAAVARGWTGHTWLGGDAAAAALGGGDEKSQAEWTPAVQEAFALFLHSVAAAVQRARVTRRATAAAALAATQEDAQNLASGAAANSDAARGDNAREGSPGRPRAKSSGAVRHRFSFRYGDPNSLDALEKLCETSGVLEDYQLARAARDEDAETGEANNFDEDDEDDGGDSDENAETPTAGGDLPLPVLSESLRASAEASALPDLREAGTFSDHYVLGTRLGEGAYSLVFRAQHIATGLDVAVKICAKERMLEADCVRLVEEVAIMARLSHPSILSLYSFYEDASAYYIVMELCPGGELFERITTRPTYSEVEARDTIRTLASALSYMHSHGIAHRDLKPENILLSSADDNYAQIKLGDLGFAKRTPPTGYTTSCGTPSYVAPEILRSEPYNQACDLWSLGVVLYILLSGYAPFSSPNQSDLFKAIVSGRFYFEPEYWSKISAPAKDLIRRLLVVDTRFRATAADVLAHPWLHGTVSTAELSTAQTAMRSFNEARRRIVKRGVLVKQGQMVRSWKRRTFVLTPTTLAYYENEKVALASTGTEAKPASSLTKSLMEAVGLASAPSSAAEDPAVHALARGVIELKDISGCEPCDLDAAALAASGCAEGAAAFNVRIAGRRTLTVVAPDLAARSSWLAAISATKAHGNLVSKAWTALGGDHAAEVIQLMSLARDWESLVLNETVATDADAVATVLDSPMSREGSAFSPVSREVSGGGPGSPLAFALSSAASPHGHSYDVLVSAKVKALREEEERFVAAAHGRTISRQSSTSNSKPASALSSPVLGSGGPQSQLPRI